MREIDITYSWKHYIEKNKPKSLETYELKFINLTKQKSFSFDRVADHQIVGLLASLEGLWFKISDTAAINGFASKKPFDAIWLVKSEAFVVIVFYMPRRFKKAIKIPIKRYLEIVNQWKLKSIKMEELEKLEGIEVIFI